MFTAALIMRKKKKTYWKIIKQVANQFINQVYLLHIILKQIEKDAVLARDSFLNKVKSEDKLNWLFLCGWSLSRSISKTLIKKVVPIHGLRPPLRFYTYSTLVLQDEFELHIIHLSLVFAFITHWPFSFSEC